MYGMRSLWALVVASAASAQTPAARAGAAPRLQSPALVLDRVTVIDVEYGVRQRNQRVVVVGNRIRALGHPSSVPIPAGAQVVDARGKYVIPGFWDMHVHPSVWSPTPEAMYRKVNAAYLQLIVNGVTGIRDAGAAVPLDSLRAFKQEIADGRRVGPRLIVSGPSINDNGPECTRENHAAPTCNRVAHYAYIYSPDEARHLVDSIKAAGADMIKIHDVSRREYFALAAAARQAGIPFGGHFTPAMKDPPDTLTGLTASDSGALILDHGEYTRGVCGDGLDTMLSLTQCAAAAAHLRRNNTWVATWSVGEPDVRQSDSLEAFMTRAFSYSGPLNHQGETAWKPLTVAERRHLPASSVDFMAAYGDSALHGPGCRRALLAYAADLPSLPGQDWPFGSLGAGVHGYMLAPALCGVPPLWLLRNATLNPARALRLTDSLGTVAVGKVADLVLLDGDPLEDIWNVSKIHSVIANGRYFNRAALDRMLIEAAAEWRTVNEIVDRVRESEKAKRDLGKTP